MAKFEGTPKDFVRSVPPDVPVAAVLDRAKEAGLDITREYVWKTRSAIKQETGKGQKLAATRSGNKVQVLLAFCRAHIDKHGKGPTINEICAGAGLSRSGTSGMMRRLRSEHVLTFDKGDYSTMKIVSLPGEAPRPQLQNGAPNGATAALVVRPKEQEGRERQSFTLAFKQAAVKLARKLGNSADAARQLGVPANCVATWTRGRGMSRGGRKGIAIDIARPAAHKRPVAGKAAPVVSHPEAQVRRRPGVKIPIENIVNADLLKLVASEIGFSRSIEILLEEQKRMLNIFRRCADYRVTGNHEEASS